MQMELAARARRSPHSPDPVNAKPAWKFYFPGGFTDSRESDEFAPIDLCESVIRSV